MFNPNLLGLGVGINNVNEINNLNDINTNKINDINQTGHLIENQFD